jgi:hypothetical protein
MVGTSTATAASKLEARQHRIDNMITKTWYRQKVMGAPLTKTNRSYRRSPSTAYVGWVERYWQGVSRRILRTFQNPPHLSAFLCIHRYEGSWQDTGSPFWGGLQMNSDFQAAYGGWLLHLKGTADHWTPLEQIWTAEKAVASRGFWPWPNTARYCGLL